MYPGSVLHSDNYLARYLGSQDIANFPRRVQEKKPAVDQRHFYNTITQTTHTTHSKSQANIHRYTPIGRRSPPRKSAKSLSR